MSLDYSSLGFSNRLRKVTALNQTVVNAVDFETKYEVSSDRVNASKVNLGNFIKKSGAGTATGNFSSVQALDLSTSINYKTPKTDVLTFGVPVIGIYQGLGTASGDQIYPIRGSNVTFGQYDVVGGVGDFSRYNGTFCEWRAMIIDTNGTSSQTITFAADWLYTDYVTGAAI